MNPPPLTAAASPQLTPEHLLQLNAARKGTVKIQRAVKIARFDGMTLGLFGALTFLIGFRDPTSMILGAGMLVACWAELRGADLLKKFNPEGTRWLVNNQLAMGGLLAIYGFWRLYLEATGRGIATSLGTIDPDTAQAIGDYSGLVHQIAYGFYALLILIAVLGQGGLAMYYQSRRKYVEAFARETPEWILKLL